MQPPPDTTLLDAAGGVGITYAPIRNYFARCLVVDLDEEALALAKRTWPKQRVVIGDIGRLPLRDGAADYVFCSAVLEHIPIERQQIVADEIRRVARLGYFVSTPNYWFPVEIHHYTPFWQFVPRRWQHRVKQYVPLPFHPRGVFERLDLLTPAQLQRYFPEGRVGGLYLRPFPIPPTIFVWWRRGA